jgi:hypothetical protein
MKLANANGRAVLIVPEGIADVESISDKRFGPTLGHPFTSGGPSSSSSPVAGSEKPPDRWLKLTWDVPLTLAKSWPSV